LPEPDFIISQPAGQRQSRFGMPPPRRASTTASWPDRTVAEMAGTSAVQKPDSVK
jgi:hypothetical protein